MLDKITICQSTDVKMCVWPISNQKLKNKYYND